MTELKVARIEGDVIVFDVTYSFDIEWDVTSNIFDITLPFGDLRVTITQLFGDPQGSTKLKDTRYFTGSVGVKTNLNSTNGESRTAMFPVC